ncbi:MAG: glutathione S-transferase family protein [Ferrovibrio sp.]|uniref:glutathione S-transferase family protein n=1 Tax=Ferrovibrio sp. TaxID=1917215 RepID=UPI00260344D8|nr:glutathione S-transferase family protein [Ferrovibrio sp.]MCW0235390.1 glutathione S-transferase family protein [Ferrovibrio sp.]
MKLYNNDGSPFAARVRMLLRAKSAQIELVKPSADFRSIAPIGKIPALLLDDGTLLPESEVICGYLDAVLGGPSLYLDTPEARARVTLMVRLSDLYLAPPLHDFFVLLFTAPGNREAIEALAPAFARGLKFLDIYVAKDGCAAEARFSQADCALSPMLFYADEVLPGLIGQPLLEKRPALAAYWQRIKAHPIAAPVLDEVRASWRSYQQKLQATQ